MSVYEFTFIVQSGFIQQEVDGLVQEFTAMLQGMGAKVMKYENWGLRDLAYPIKKFSKGYYFMMCIEISKDSLPEFKRKVRLNENVIRYVYCSINSVPEEDSSMVVQVSEE